MILGNPITLGGAKKKERLPDGYQEVEWIGTSYGQTFAETPYIDTGIRVSTSTRFEFECQFTHQDPTSNDIYGSFGLYGRDVICQIVQERHSTLQKINLGASTASPLYELATDPASEAWQKIVISSTYRQIGEKQDSTALTFSTSLLTIYIGRSNTWWTADWHGGIKYKTIYRLEDDDLLNEFVPCYRLDTFEPGVYDTVGGLFMPKTGGSSNFIVGPDVN